MGPTTISLVGAVILILDIFAIASVLLGYSNPLRKVFWIAIILLLPVIGIVPGTSVDARIQKLDADIAKLGSSVGLGRIGQSISRRVERVLIDTTLTVS